MKYITINELITLLKTNNWKRRQYKIKTEVIKGNLKDEDLNETIKLDANNKDTFKTYTYGYIEVRLSTTHDAEDIKIIYEECYEYFNDDINTFNHGPVDADPLLFFSLGIQVTSEDGRRAIYDLPDLSCKYNDSEEYVYMDDILKSNKLFRVNYFDILKKLI